VTYRETEPCAGRVPQHPVVGALLAFLCLLGIACAFVAPAEAVTEDGFPLRAADTSSPRDTLRTFLRDFAEGVAAWRSNEPLPQVRRPLHRAAETIDFGQIGALRRSAAMLIDMALLREILDRVDLPPEADVPGDEEVAAARLRDDPILRWVVPNTKIEIVLVADGPHAGEYRFSRETVAELRNYYALVREVPYKPGAMAGIYEEVLASPGEWLSQSFSERLPDWATQVVAGRAVWQWLAVAGLLAVVAVAVPLLIGLGRRWDRRHRDKGPWMRFGLPLALLLVVGLCAAASAVTEKGIGLLDAPLDVVVHVLLAVQILALCWLVLAMSGWFADAVGRLGSQRDGRRRLDVALTRILFRIASVVLLFLIGAGAAETLGIPLAPLVAGLGVGGLAIALAVRPTLENVIGGLTLFADRPVRVGDFCRYGGEVGTVEAIGLRSTRIRTLERSVVSVPNSEFSQMQLDNFAQRDQRLINTVLHLRYETTPDQMRHVLARIRELLVAHPMVAPEPARARFVGYSTYGKDIAIFAYLRCQDENDFLAIREEILLRIEDIVAGSGTGLAIPSQTTYLARDAGIDAERRARAEKDVAAWRAEGRLPAAHVPRPAESPGDAPGDGPGEAADHMGRRRAGRIFGMGR